jgi:hypothetical protein
VPGIECLLLMLNVCRERLDAVLRIFIASSSSS